MAEKKTCPSCQKEIDADAKKCPECQTELEILYWEIETESGEKVLHSGEQSVRSIREELISGKLKLSNRSRQYIEILQRVEDGKRDYGLKEEMEWKILRDYADQEFQLQVLYRPVPAYGKRVAQITAVIFGVIVAIGWTMDILLAAGINPLIALVISIALLGFTPTVVGLGIIAFGVGVAYDITFFSLIVRPPLALIAGLIVAIVVGLPIGFMIGVLIGLTRKKVLKV